jgi:hypothetical protein
LRGCATSLCVCVLIASSEVLSIHRREVGGLCVIFFSLYRASGCLIVLERGSVGWIGGGTCMAVEDCTAVFSAND